MAPPSSIVNATSNCQLETLYTCFVVPTPSGTTIFGFAEFLSALALLLVLYTIADVRYQFRLSVTRVPLFRTSFLILFLIGLASVLSDAWFAEGWLLPDYLTDQVLWQTTIALSFLLLVMTWTFFAFIQPPKFSETNARRFARSLYQRMVEGSDADLPIIANELARSALPLVRLSRLNNEEAKTVDRHDAAEFAHIVLLLIGGRKLCRHIVASSTTTAIAFFSAMTELKKYNVPLGQFVKNVSTEAILNMDSALHHEDDGFRAGLLGYWRPFSKAVYGDYELVESLGKFTSSPLDMDYQVIRKWNASQFEAYCRATLITIESYLTERSWDTHSYSIYRAFDVIKSSCGDCHTLDGLTREAYNHDAYLRLRAAVDFVKDSIELIVKNSDLSEIRRWRVSGPEHARQNFLDHIASLMLEIITCAASVTGPMDTCWSIHHNVVWTNFFGWQDQPAWKIIRFKLRRLLYDEVVRKEYLLDFQSAKILGLCLSVMGIHTGPKRDHETTYFALRRTLAKWTARNYLAVRDKYPDLADACLIGSISFDEKNERLVKTYAKSWEKVADKDYLVCVR